MVVATYKPEVFDVTSLAEAQHIILTPEDKLETSERWATETPYLAKLIQDELSLTAESFVLDYGCGIGRLSKELIRVTGCRVLGVDISANMRTFAHRYVESDRFSVVSPDMLGHMVRAQLLTFDAVIAVWVLQHCLEVEVDVALIRAAAKWRGGLFVVNEERRCVPTHMGWVDDGKDVRALLSENFKQQHGGRLDPKIVSDRCHRNTYWQQFQA